MSYLIPTEDLSLAQQEQRRRDAVVLGAQALVGKSVVGAASMVDDRAAEYAIDFIQQTTTAALALGLAGWLTMPLAAVGTRYSVFATNAPLAVNPIVPINQVWVFYGVAINTPGRVVSNMLFTKGTAGNRYRFFDLEPLYSKMTTDGYFTQPVVYVPSDVVGCTVMCRVPTNLAAEVVLKTLVLEPKGQNVT